MAESEYSFYPFNHKNVVIDGNVAVVNGASHKCGYVCLHAQTVPAEWHGNYNADALQYLNIHGGITYCEVEGGDELARRAAAKSASESAPAAASDSLADRCAQMDARRSARHEAKLSVPYDYVVFGFDCGHLHDDEDPDLQDTDYVMGLAHDMQQVLIAYAARIVEWRAADYDRRIAIIEEINATAKRRSPMGFGAMIGMLTGAKEFGV